MTIFVKKKEDILTNPFQTVSLVAIVWPLNVPKKIFLQFLCSKPLNIFLYIKKGHCKNKKQFGKYLALAHQT